MPRNGSGRLRWRRTESGSTCKLASCHIGKGVLGLAFELRDTGRNQQLCRFKSRKHYLVTPALSVGIEL